MSDRGFYRGVYSAMLDDPDYQALSPSARHVLLTLRLCPQNNAASLFRIYPAVLRAQTGYGPAKIETAMAELEAGRWIERDGTIVWIRNGLRYDPYLRLADDKHLKAVAKAIVAYSKSPLFIRFCEYYQIACPSEGHGKAQSKGHLRGIPKSSSREEKNPNQSSTPPEGLSAHMNGTEDGVAKAKAVFAEVANRLGISP